jgi:biotin-(acetyl-CoA carboxylase) ligase
VETETHRPVDRLVLLRMYLQKLIHWCGRLDTTDFLQAWEKHLAWRGEWVRLSPSGSDLEAVEGRLAGLTPEGYLLLQSRDGREVIFQTGEVRLRP